MSGDRYFITDQHETYFITCTIVEWIDLFTRIEYKEIICDSFNYCIQNKGFVLNSWVLMTNHLHFIGRCVYPHRMSDFLRDFKKFTSKRLAAELAAIPESRQLWLLDKFSFEARKTSRAEEYKIWKDDNHAINLSGMDVFQTIEYIHNNPVRAGITFQPQHYIYGSAIDYHGKKGLIDVEVL